MRKDKDLLVKDEEIAEKDEAIKKAEAKNAELRAETRGQA